MFFHLVSFKDGAGRHQKSGGEQTAALSFSLPIPTRLCERIVRVSNSLLHIHPKVSEHEGCALKSTSVLKHTLRRTLSFPDFLVA